MKKAAMAANGSMQQARAQRARKRVERLRVEVPWGQGRAGRRSKAVLRRGTPSEGGAASEADGSTPRRSVPPLFQEETGPAAS